MTTSLPVTPGEIITFYSYKGGTGRSMALSNVACLLAEQEAQGRGVLMIDWDLEAPGLHKFFHDKFKWLSHDEFTGKPGLIDLFLKLREDTLDSDFSNHEEAKKIANSTLDNIDLNNFIIKTDIPNLSLLKAGHIDREYSYRVRNFDWEKLYNKSPLLIRILGERLSEQYKYVLIDSRTGFTDIGGICTMILPQKLVIVFTPNRQSYEGINELVNKITEYRIQSSDLRPLLVYPLPSRIENSRAELRADWRFGNKDTGIIGYQPMFEDLFKKVYDLSICKLNEYFEEVQIQQSPDYAYGEEIAIKVEKTVDRFSLTRSYKTFTEQLVKSASPWQSMTEKINSLNIYAQKLCDEGKYSEAIKTWKEVLSLDSENKKAIEGINNTNLSSYFNVPFQPNPYFTGRKDILIKLHNVLKSDKTATFAQAISGLGGIGKTQTAVQYAFMYGSEYNAVFWVKADSREALISDYIALAHVLDLPEKDAKEQDLIVAAVRLWLENNTGWLLVFDNADEPGLLKNYIPINQKGHILLTSRAQVFDNIGISKPFELEKMLPDEAKEFLLKRTGLSNPTQADNEAILKIAEELDYLPLALEQAGAYVKELNTSFSNYLSSYRTRGLDMFKKHPPVTFKYPESVATIWILNFEQVEKTSKASAELLTASAFLNPDNIPLELIIKGAPELGETISSAIDGIEKDPLVLEELLFPLTRYSLISRDARSYSIHRLVQTVIRDRIGKDAERVWAERTVKAINNTFPDVEFSNWHICERLILHAQAGAKYIKKYAFEFEEAGSLLNKVGNYEFERAQYADAEQMYGEALDIFKKAIGIEHPSVAQLLNNLADLYKAQGKYAEAEPIYRRALTMREKSLGSDHPSVAQSLNNLADLYKAQGKYDEAEPMYRRALTMRENSLGFDHPSVAQSLNNLAELYYSQGKYDEAEPMYRRALTMRENSLGFDHPSVAQSLNNLAELYYSQGKYAESEIMYTRAKNIWEKSLGKEHPNTLASVNGLAMLLKIKGDYEGAESLLCRAQEARERVLGNEHPDTLTSVNNLAMLLESKGDYEGAEPLFRRMLEARRRILGSEHPDTLTSVNNLAVLLESKGDYEGAEPLYRRALEVRERILGSEHPDTLMSVNNLAMLLESKGDYEGAEPLYRRALEGIYKVSHNMGSAHPHQKNMVNNYAGCLQEMGMNEVEVRQRLEAVLKSPASMSMISSHPDRRQQQDIKRIEYDTGEVQFNAYGRKTGRRGGKYQIMELMTQTWKTVRIFISSTFRDMHAERDHLVKVVFPELRERCTKRQLHLIDIDLRWGVTEEEAEQGKVLESILDEVERSRPFFIGILGERYGSIPKNIPKDAELAHLWLKDYPDHSLTALEIIHGVLIDQKLAKRSFFYFRDPQFISKIPENIRDDYIAENSDAALKLEVLKDKIRSSKRPVRNYPCRWDDSKKSLVDLDLFGQLVLEDLWTAIKEEYPEGAPQFDPLIIERQMHEAFVEERSHLHIGRIEEAAQLTQHVKSTDKQPMVITGESGIGKSAFLASWYRQYVAEHPDDHVLAYFIGSSPDSIDHMRLLRNMCKELKSNFNLEEKLPEDDKKLSELLMSLLLAASQGRRIVILLDALDQLSATEGASSLSWLLDYLPANVHLVVSSQEGDSLEVLRQRGTKEIALQQLSAGEQRQIVHDRLSEWGRKLDEQQISALLAHPGVKNPLYLRVALEELRLFGSYEHLTERIEALAYDVSHLFEQVLARLEEDHGREFVAEAFSLLGSSRYGLGENELLELLHRKGEEQLPRVLWARLSRSAKAYLVQRGELVGFFHRHLTDAVSARYLNNENRHAKLAAYFEQMPLERKLDEYPYQLQHAKEWQSLATALSDLDFFEYAWNKGRKYEWMTYWESLKESYDPQNCYQKVIDNRLNSTGKTVEIARYMNKIGEFLSGMSIYIPALSMFENSFAILKPLLGSDHPEVAALLYNIARAYDKQYGESKSELTVQYYDEAYEIYMKLGKPLEASEAKIESANFKRRALKRLKEAKKDCEEAKKTLESMSEKDHSYKLLYARCLNILGLIYSGLGDSVLVNQCQNLFQQSIKYKKDVGDLDGIGESENAMGLFLRNTANRDLNKINEAIDHLKISLEIRNSIGNYRGAAQSYRNLGMCYTDRIAIIEDLDRKEESYRLAKQSYLNGINYWNKRIGKPPIEDLLEFKYRLGELEINQGNKKNGINILEELQEERNIIGDWHNRARALDLLLKAYRGTNESKVTAHKIITIYQNVLADKTKIKQIYEEPVRFKNAKDFLERIIKEVPDYEGITSKIIEDISKIFDDNRG